MNYGLDARLVGPTEPAQTLLAVELTRNLALQATKNHEQVHVYTGQAGQEALRSCVGAVLHALPVPLHRLTAGLLWNQVILPVQARMDHLDLIHSPFFFLPRHGLPRRMKRVITVHDLAFAKNPREFSRRTLFYFKTIARGSIENADAIVVSCGAVGNDVAEYYGIAPEKIHVIPLGLKPSLEACARSTTVVSRPSTGAEPFVLNVGVIHSRKNLDVLLKAFQLARHTLPSLKLRLVGRPAHGAPQIFALIDDLGLRDHVIHEIHVSEERLRHYYGHAAAVVMPSRSEGFGFPALEAMACGAAVIACRSGSLPELVGDAGEYFEPGNVEELAQLILARVNSGSDSALASRAKKQALQFTWSRTASLTLALYRGLCG